MLFVVIFVFLLLSGFTSAGSPNTTKPLAFEINEVVVTEVYSQISESTVPEGTKIELYTSFRNVGSSPFYVNSTTTVDVIDNDNGNLEYQGEFDYNDTLDIGDYKGTSYVLGDDLSPGEYMVNATVVYRAENETLGEDEGLDKGTKSVLHMVVVEGEEETEPDRRSSGSGAAPPDPSEEIEFVERVVFKEMVPGEEVSIPMSFKNSGTASASVDLEVDDQDGWHSIDFTRENIESGEVRGFFLDMDIPMDTESTAKEMEIKALGTQDEVLDSTTLYIRIKSVPEHRPIIKRNVHVDGEQGETYVGMELWNPTDNSYDIVELNERISEEIPVEIDKIDFDPSPKAIYEEEKEVLWSFFEIGPDDSRGFGYGFGKPISVDVDYSQWYTRDISFRRDRLFDDIEVEEVEVKDIEADGLGYTSFLIKNKMDRDIGFEVRPGVPDGWSINPEVKDGVVKAGETEEVEFSIRIRKEVEPGTYVLDYEFLLDGSILRREQEVDVTEEPVFPTLRIILGVAILILSLFVFFLFYRKKKRNAYEARFGR